MTHSISKYFSDSGTLDRLSVTELEGLISEAPSSSLYRMLLAKKMNSGHFHDAVLTGADHLLVENYLLNSNISTLAVIEEIDELAERTNLEVSPIPNATVTTSVMGNKTIDLEINSGEPVSNDNIIIETESLEIDPKEIIEEYQPEQDVDVDQVQKPAPQKEVEKPEDIIKDTIQSPIIEQQKQDEKKSVKSYKVRSQSNDEQAPDKQVVTKKYRIKSEAVTSEPSQKRKKMKKKFKLKEFSGISDYSQWLMSFKKEDLEKKIRKEEKKAKKRELEESARKSITKSDAIVSEPLADILVQQGHFDDAKKMYEHLMHKYPEKSSYFAAKIENLLKI
ncbi:MAG: hypothetical protein J5I52_02950 [Saprospiraceae bacterium]|nr:hypothetical protein [Saprospiraceae bacterium]